MSLAWAEKYMQIPFVEGGRTWKGCDCYGLIRLILESQAGLDLPKYEIREEDYVNVNRAIMAEERQNWKPVAIGDERPFDIAVMLSYTLSPIREGHFGIVVEPGYILHSEKYTGPVFSAFRSTKFRTEDRFTKNRLCRLVRHRYLEHTN